MNHCCGPQDAGTPRLADGDFDLLANLLSLFCHFLFHHWGEGKSLGSAKCRPQNERTPLSPPVLRTQLYCAVEVFQRVPSLETVDPAHAARRLAYAKGASFDRTRPPKHPGTLNTVVGTRIRLMDSPDLFLGAAV